MQRGETLGLVGESGCGKTTIGRLMLRLIDPTSGKIIFDGTDITTMKSGELKPYRRRMQIIFQDPFSSLDPRSPIGDSIGDGLRIHDVGDTKEREKRVARMMDLVGLASYQAPRYPHEFSGGQRQRIGIARALILEPDLVVCDEPVSALDVSIQAQVLNLLKELQRELGLTLMFIAHNMAVVEHISDRVAVMYLGRVVEQAKRETVFRDPRHPYTKALMSAIPLPDPDARRQRIILGGDVPSPVAIPPGCRFRERCWLYEQLGRPENCKTDDPQLRQATRAFDQRDCVPLRGAIVRGPRAGSQGDDQLGACARIAMLDRLWPVGLDLAGSGSIGRIGISAGCRSLPLEAAPRRARRPLPRRPTADRCQAPSPLR